MRKNLHVNVCVESPFRYFMNGLTVILVLLFSIHSSQAQDLILNTYSGQSEIKTYKGGTITLKNGFNTAGHNVHIFISSEIQPVPVVPPVLSSNQNYVATWAAKLPLKDPNLLISKPLKDVQLSVQYYDGLGRLVQTVLKQGSLTTATGASGDLVTVKSYDQYGRDSSTLLPYVAMGAANGSYKEGSVVAQQSWYNATSSPVNDQGETGSNARSLTVFEASPLNRVAETYGPGDSWIGTARLSEAQRRAIKHKYWINTAADGVRIWDAGFISSPGSGFGNYTSASAYPAGELYKNVTINEAGKQVIEFKDKEGHTILKKVQLTTTDGGTGSGHAGWLCTYYIYDDLNNLRCVIQPKGVELLSSGSNNWSMTTAIGKLVLNEQCFRYEYDNRGRMIIKKVPGIGSVYMVYDKHDRLVMRQDSLMRPAHNWIATHYDGLNRPDTTWLYNSGPSTFSNILTVADSSGKYPVSVPTASNILTGTHYDDYSGLTLPTGMSISYKGDWDSYFIPGSTTSYPYPEKPTQTTEITTRGLITWSQNKVLDSTPVLQLPTINIYDHKGRLIQTQSRNFTGGIDVTTTQYSWRGLPLIIVQKQEEKKGGTSQITTVVTKMSYDDLARIVKTEQRQSNNKIAADSMTNFVVLSEMQYDAIGQVKQKFLGRRKSSTNAYINTPLEKQLYDYNIRGWLLGVNRDYVRDAASTNTSATVTSQTISGEMFTESSMDIQSVIYPSTNFFGFDLAYDKIDNVLIGSTHYDTAKFDGNIAGMSWKGANDKKIRKYDYSYDANNRLIKAAFSQYSSAGFSNSTVNYTVDNLKYDANGNILSMNQYGLKNNGLSAIIDQLTYNYSPNTNKLLNVIDKYNDPNSDLGDFKYPAATKAQTTIDYTYDGNGNLITDKNKKITGITYNILNLPSVLTVETNKGSIKYYYDAAGNKLRKRTVDNTITPSKTTVTTYIGGAVYLNDTLQFFGTTEGRVRPNSTRNAWIYDYFLKDHLANTRMLITDDYNVSSPILEASSYYPFGLEQKGIGLKTTTLNYPGNKNKFVSQLLDDDLGLNWYQFRYRNHDPQIGRFIEVDPVASDYPFNSPFAYAENRPINGIDLEGKEFLDAVKNLNNPYLASYYFSEWANSYSESINAGMRLQAGTSGAAATAHMPDGIAKNAVSLTAQLQDIQTASKPLVDELNTFATIGSFIPFGEAGLGSKAASLGMESLSSLSISEISSGFGKEAGFSLKSTSSTTNAAKGGGRVFWSGGDVAKNAAMDFAKANGMKTLEMTTGGRIMNSVGSYFPRSISSPIWDGLSSNFARGAVGNINVFQNAAGVSLKSTWRRIEYPILQNNKIFYHTVK